MSSPRLRALIYNRVSADHTGRRISTASQHEENAAYCRSQGWEIVDAITDDARSASRYAVKERSGYARVTEALKGRALGRIDVLVCWEASRTTRDLQDYVELRQLCEQYKVKLAYKGRVYDLGAADDRFVTGLDALVAERESELIRERALRGHRMSLERGTPRGAIPYGFLHEYNPVTGAMAGRVPDPETAPIVREAVRRVVEGETLYAIAADLNQRGVPTPRGRRDQLAGLDTNRRWNTTILRQVLASQAVIGVRSYQGKAVRDGTWPAIVDAAAWRNAQLILADPARRSAARGSELRHLLAGIPTCGVCTGPLRSSSVRGRPVYKCEGVEQTGSKGHVSRAVEALDRFVERPLLRRLQRPDIRALLVVVPAGEDGPIAEAQQELESLEARLAEFAASAADGGISVASFAAIEARLLERIAEARARAVPAGVPAPVLELVAGDPAALWVRWGVGPEGLGKKRQVIRALMSIVVHRSQRRGRNSREFDASSVKLSWRSGAL